MTFRDIAAIALDEAGMQDGDDYIEPVITEDDKKFYREQMERGGAKGGAANPQPTADAQQPAPSQPSPATSSPTAAPGKGNGGGLADKMSFDLEQHDRRFHGGHYDGKSVCKYREKMAASMQKAGVNPSAVKGLGGTAGAVGGNGGGKSASEPSEAEKTFMDLKARYEKEGQTEISKEEFEKAQMDYLVAELGQVEADAISKLKELAKSNQDKGAKAEAAADRILGDPNSSNAQKEGAKAIKEARKEWKVNGKTYVDLSGMSFWDAMKEAWKAGYAGKEIVTDWDKMTGRWDNIIASDPNFKEANGLLQEGVKDALADLGFGEDFENAQKIEGLSREQWQEIGFLKHQFDTAKSAKEKHAAWRQLKDYLKEQGLEKDEKGGKTGNKGTLEPIAPTYKGPLANDSLLDPETADSNDAAYGEDCAKKLADRLDKLGIKASGKGEAHVGPSATVVEFPVDASYNIKRAKGAIANLGAAIGANITSVGYAPGKADTLRIEFTNDKMRKVGFANLIKSKEWDEKKDKYAIPTVIGKSSSGEDIVQDEAKMPHEVVTGETGSGKSVYLQAKINSAQMAKTPQEYQQVLIDPKRQEFGNQTGSPYNMFPVQFTPEGAARVVASLREQMEKRASMLGVNLDEYDETKNEYISGSDANLQAYNARQTDPSKKLPFVKIYIDELAALTKDPTYGPQIEADLDQLMAKARSIGFSFTLSSQRNDVASIKGSIAANAPSRMIFKAANDDAKASRAAKSLGGEGDFIHRDKNGKETRGRACFISDGEKERIAAFYRNGGRAQNGGAASPTQSPSPSPSPSTAQTSSPAPAPAPSLTTMPTPTPTKGGASPSLNKDAWKVAEDGKESSLKKTLDSVMRRSDGGWKSVEAVCGDGVFNKGFKDAGEQGGDELPSHGMAKATTVHQAVSDLLELISKGTDPSRNGGQLYFAPLAKGKGSGAAFSAASGTAAGTSYRNGPFILVGKPGCTFNGDLKDLGAVLVNDGSGGEGLGQITEDLRREIHKVRPDLMVENFSNAGKVAKTLSGKTSLKTTQASGQPQTTAKPSATQNQNPTPAPKPTSGQPAQPQTQSPSPAPTSNGQQQGGAANGGGSSTGNNAQPQQVVQPGQTVTNLTQSQVKRAEAMSAAQKKGVDSFNAAQKAKNQQQEANRNAVLNTTGFADDEEGK